MTCRTINGSPTLAEDLYWAFSVSKTCVLGVIDKIFSSPLTDFLRLEGGGLTSVKIAIFIRVIIIRQTPIREVMLEMVA